MPREHAYRTTVRWTGDRGTGTSGYRDYDRAHEISAPGKASVLSGSADPSFRGDPSAWNPEELLLASLSACHMLWYLGLCAAAGVAVTGYVDAADGEMIEAADGGGRFTGVTLRPRVTLAEGADRAKAEALHHDAHDKCFIANSVNFPVAVAPEFV